MQETYTQCRLTRKTESGYLEKVCWIPSKGAVKDNIITLKDVSGDWKIVSVGKTMDARLIKNQSHNSGDIWVATSGPQPRGNK
jgi:hypothetical protein